jgi:hypothetical protein
LDELTIADCRGLPFQDDTHLPDSGKVRVMPHTDDMDLHLWDDTTGQRSRFGRAPCALVLAAVCLLGGCVSMALCAPPAPAAATSQEDAASFAVIGGPLQLEVGAPRVAADADPSTLQVPFAVTDARGTGAGWTVSASFVSDDARAGVTAASVKRLDPTTAASAQLAPTDVTVRAPSDDLTASARPILSVAPGPAGMGRFAGQLDVSVLSAARRQIAGRLTLTLSSAP